MQAPKFDFFDNLSFSKIAEYDIGGTSSIGSEINMSLSPNIGPFGQIDCCINDASILRATRDQLSFYCLCPSPFVVAVTGICTVI